MHTSADASDVFPSSIVDVPVTSRVLRGRTRIESVLSGTSMLFTCCRCCRVCVLNIGAVTVELFSLLKLAKGLCLGCLGSTTFSHVHVS